ncbi:MAG: galactitol-1-phosphate 5-dehydrogenase [Candidatus Caldatribacteriaceae bacterium]
MSVTMKALVLEGKGRLRLTEVPVPEPRENEALIRVRFCGVCGSDLPRIFGDIAYFYPLIPGHEFSGEVVAVGKTEHAGWVGRRVTVYPLIPCRRCPYCEMGWYELCEDYGYLGSRQNGAFAEYVVAPVANLVPLPENVSLEEGALTEPAAVTLHAVRRVGGCLGENVAVFGLGPVGLLVGMWLKLGGARRLIGYDVDESKFQLARKVGFDVTLFPSFFPAEQGGIGLVVEASGSKEALTDALKLVRKKGRVLLLGNQEGEVTLKAEDFGRILRKELTVVGSWNSSYTLLDSDWRRVLDLEETRRISLGILISHRIRLEEALEFLLGMKERKFPYVKVVLVP